MQELVLPSAKALPIRPASLLRTLLLCVSVLLLLSFLFFLLSFSTAHDSEVASLNFEIEKWNEGRTAEMMESVRMMMKVMPSPGHGVVDRMELVQSERSSWRELPVRNELMSYSVAFHSFTSDTSLMFPTLAFNGQMVPVGLSQEKCVYFSYAPAESAERSSAYESVDMLPVCSSAQRNEHDPKAGVRVHAWRQKEVDIACEGKSCGEICRQQRGWWVSSKSHSPGTCYSYSILDTVCIKLRRTLDRFGQPQLSYSGGCFAQNQTEKYFQGDPGSVYSFQNVTVEVRSEMDPYVIAIGVTDDSLSFSASMKWAAKVSVGCFVTAVAGAGVLVAGIYYRKWTE